MILFVKFSEVCYSLLTTSAGFCTDARQLCHDTEGAAFRKTT